jgi:hypothetical protein
MRSMGERPEAVRIEGRVIVWYARGYLTRTQVLEAHDAIARHLAAEPGTFEFLFDGSEMQGFEPGTPALSTLRMPRYRGRLRRIAIVVTRNPMLAAARTVTYLLPWLPVGIFGTRAEADAWVHDRRTKRTA